MKKETTIKIQKSAFLSSLMAMVMALSLPAESRAALSLVNADFQDTTGLTFLGGGWYGGVPAGWTGVNENYTVINWNSGNLAANLDSLTSVSPTFAPLYQSAGLLDSTGIVSLSFDILHLVAGPTVGVGIFNTNGSSNYSAWTALALPASGGYSTAGRITLETAAPITSGTSIGVAFWHTGGGAPGIDNVTLIPEPSALSLLVMGSALTLVVASRRRR